MWQDNLMRFYLQNDIENALVMGNELLESLEWIDGDLGEKEKTDLKFNLGTAYIL